MDDTITIIEGPPPVFEPVQDGWALGLSEGRDLAVTVMTRLRTFNGPALVERCYRQWRNRETIQLHYRTDLGLEQKTPIVAARSVDTHDGQVLLLWLNFDRDEVELEVDGDDKDHDEFDE